jgi:antitoxin ParD1/3/4
MASSLKLTLTDELRRYIDARMDDNDVYATPSEFIRDLIRRDMQDWAIVRDIAQGLEEARRRDFSPESILDILNES